MYSCSRPVKKKKWNPAVTGQVEGRLTDGVPPTEYLVLCTQD